MSTPKTPPTNLPSPQKVKLDWKAYFLEFCKVHGEPEIVGNRLFFPDGWSYSSTDYGGPEWPPNPDNRILDREVKKYWQIRAARVGRILSALQHEKRILGDLQRSHSLPCQQVTLVEGDGGKLVRGYVPLDPSVLDTKIRWCKQDLQECGQRLAELERVQ